MQDIPTLKSWATFSQLSTWEHCNESNSERLGLWRYGAEPRNEIKKL